MRPFLIPSVALGALALVLPACSQSPVTLTPKLAATATPVGATPTPTPPGATATPTAVSTATATAIATATPTPLASATAMATVTPTPVATATPIATATPTATPSVSPTPVPSPTSSASAQPQMIYMNLSLNPVNDPTFGYILAYTNTSTDTNSAVATLVHGSQIVFFNSDSGRTPHSASGLGQSGFPASFTNAAGSMPSGTTIDSTDASTWSTGRVNGAGGVSAAFTLGAPGNYYYGCVYHYASNQMEDVIVSQ